MDRMTLGQNCSIGSQDRREPALAAAVRHFVNWRETAPARVRLTRLPILAVGGVPGSTGSQPAMAAWPYDFTVTIVR